MDVTAPRQTATPPTPAHKDSGAPAPHSSVPTPAGSQEASPVSTVAHIRTEAMSEPRPAPSAPNEPEESVPTDKTPTPLLEQAVEQPVQTPSHIKNQNPLPIGAIVGAVCLMIGLSAVAILVYLQSQ